MNAKLRPSFTKALLPLLALPLLVQTHAAQAADQTMDACIKAFVSANVDKDRPVTVRRINTVDDFLYSSASSRSIHLTADLKNSGKRMAEATCVVTGNEVVLTMEGKPAMRYLAQADAT